MDKGFLTAEEVAKRWRITSPTVLSFIHAGDLAAYKFGKQYRIPVDVVEEFEKTNKLPKEKA